MFTRGLHQLKRLINRTVYELSSVGLKPALLHELLGDEGEDTKRNHEHGQEADANLIEASTTPEKLPRVIFAITDGDGRIRPHLRVLIESTPLFSNNFRSTRLSSSELEELHVQKISTDVERKNRDCGDSIPSRDHVDLFHQQLWQALSHAECEYHVAPSTITDDVDPCDT